MIDCEQLQTPLLATTTALIERRSCGLVWVAWTDFGGVGVGRRAILGKSDKFSQDSSHPGVDPVPWPDVEEYLALLPPQSLKSAF